MYVSVDKVMTNRAEGPNYMADWCRLGLAILEIRGCSIYVKLRIPTTSIQKEREEVSAS